MCAFQWAFLTSGVTVETFDEAGAGLVGGTVAAGIDLGGVVFAAEGTCFAVR